MSVSQDLSKGKHEKHSQRRRTMFTEKQLQDLNLLFNKNPYPDPSLKKEMASKMNIHPTVLQVWFKNHRAKLRKARCRPVQEDSQSQQLPEDKVKTSPSQRNMHTLPRPPSGAYPTALVYRDHLVPSFQLSVCPNFKVPTDHSSHKIVHFGCCQDPNVYCLYPILES
ncbi:divergent paired-related homeobox [Cynocephalus volans]|uniref:divergent paired-related homeobox n=1 Tax=Cynocephalus volans TaxID=110931 RepID=UPI002FCAF10C